MKKHRFLTLVLPIITLILEILPYGAVCNFALDGGTQIRRLYSYFDLTPYGYANFAPLITAVLTCVLLALAVIYTASGKKLLKALVVISAITTVISLCPLLYGIKFFSLVGAFISVTLAAQTVLSYFLLKS